jgi:hypothetical protein
MNKFNLTPRAKKKIIEHKMYLYLNTNDVVTIVLKQPDGYLLLRNYNDKKVVDINYWYANMSSAKKYFQSNHKWFVNEKFYFWEGKY